MKYSKTWNTDDAMVKIWRHLLRDFRGTLGSPGFFKEPEEALTRGYLGKEALMVEKFRSYKWPAKCQAPPYLFKMQYQLECFLKRYRFKHEVMGVNELKVDAYKRFTETQIRIASPMDVTEVVYRVIQRARVHCKRILGKYDGQEHYDLCRFGKRACVGAGLESAYPDIKWREARTGSEEHIRWFKRYLRKDPFLKKCLRKCTRRVPTWTVCKELALATVPKKFNSLRMIRKPTLLGSFYTDGLGKVLVDRLEREGLDLRHMQPKHMQKAQKYSVTRSHVTADLSQASDSLTGALLNRILPREWYNVVKLGRIDKTRLDDKVVHTETFMTMGDGHTFPLQTLVYYSLLLAIGELLGLKLKYAGISVFGDDLIYPKMMHGVVRHVFKRIHLILNNDKTFVEDNFRESCGGDYYHGIDVRPAMPSAGFCLLTKTAYSAYLYKIYNGLRARWAEEELPTTFRWLLAELANTADTILQVPPSYPDYSGIQTDHILSVWHVPYEPVYVTWRDGCTHRRFRLITEKAKTRDVWHESPYYWFKLGSMEFPRQPSIYDDVSDILQLRFIREEVDGLRKRTFRSKLTGKRERCQQACTSLKTAAPFNVQMASVSTWA